MPQANALAIAIRSSQRVRRARRAALGFIQVNEAGATDAPAAMCKPRHQSKPLT